MLVSPSDLHKGKRYTVTVGTDDPQGPTHRQLFNVVYRGAMTMHGERYAVFEGPYMIHLVYREALYEIEPWRITL